MTKQVDTKLSYVNHNARKRENSQDPPDTILAEINVFFFGNRDARNSFENTRFHTCEPPSVWTQEPESEERSEKSQLTNLLFWH